MRVDSVSSSSREALAEDSWSESALSERAWRSEMAVMLALNWDIESWIAVIYEWTLTSEDNKKG